MKPFGRATLIRLLIYLSILGFWAVYILPQKGKKPEREPEDALKENSSQGPRSEGGPLDTNDPKSLDQSIGTSKITPTPDQDVPELYTPIQFTASQLQSWLDQKKGNPSQLAQAKIVAGMLLNHAEMIRAGVESDPGNPQAAYIGATHDSFSQEEQLQYSRQFFQNAPENALASYLYAARLFESGDQNAAIRVLHESKDRQLVDDYSLATKQFSEDAYLHAGASELSAKFQSWASLQKPYLRDILSFAGELDDVADSLPQSEAKSLRQVTASMGSKTRQSVATGTIIEQLSGLAIEEKSLEGLGHDEPSHYEGMTTLEVKESIQQEREEIKTVMKQMDIDSLIRSSHPDLLQEFVENIWKIGELEAVKEFRQKANKHSSQ